VIVWKLVGPQQVPLANLDPIDPQLLRRKVEQPLTDEHAMLAAGAANGRDDGLVREDRGELCFVVFDVVRSKQRALRVDRDGQPIRIVGAGVEQEAIANSEHASVARQCDLRVVHLPTLLRGRVEVLLAILGPLDWTSEAHRRPRHDEFFRVEHHDLRTEPAADEGSDDSDLRLEQAQFRGQAVADGDRRLSRVPHREFFGVTIPLREHRAVLDGS
jgi:hypothetical protein